MTVEELRVEAKKLGYNILKISKKEKLLPCTCGGLKRDHFVTLCGEVWYDGLRCTRCGKQAIGKNERDAIRNWNKMIRGE